MENPTPPQQPLITENPAPAVEQNPLAAVDSHIKELAQAEAIQTAEMDPKAKRVAKFYQEEIHFWEPGKPPENTPVDIEVPQAQWMPAELLAPILEQLDTNTVTWTDEQGRPHSYVEGTSPLRSTEDVMSNLKAGATFWSEGIQFAQEHELPVNQDMLVEAAKLGKDFGLFGNEKQMAIRDKTRRFVGAKAEIGPQRLQDNIYGFYPAVATVLHEFCQANAIPETQEAVPHLLAFVAGAYAHDNGAIINATTVRDLMVDLLPQEQKKLILEGEEWKETVTQESPGLGSLIGQRKEQKGFLELSGMYEAQGAPKPIADAMNTATKTVTELTKKIYRNAGLKADDEFRSYQLREVPTLKPVK